MCRKIIKRIISPVVVILFASCTATTWVDGPNGRSCKAYCNTLASDGESCVEWSETASDACVGKYTPVHACCTNFGSCQTYSPIAKGLQCACVFSGPGGIAQVPGVGCN